MGQPFENFGKLGWSRAETYPPTEITKNDNVFQKVGPVPYIWTQMSRIKDFLTFFRKFWFI